MQKAGFTIEEIRELLKKDAEEIFYAFEIKIAEEEKRIREIKAIQRTYQTEVTIMKNNIEKMRKTVKKSMNEFDAAAEFGIDSESYKSMVKDIDALFERALEHEDFPKYELTDNHEETRLKAEQEFEERFRHVSNELVFERHGWKNVKEFINDIPDFSQGEESFFLFKLGKEKANNIGFANALLGIMCAKDSGINKKLNCNIISSEDGDNHFWLMKSKVQ